MISSKKKKAKTILSMMNKQNKRFIPIATPLVEMMEMVTSEIDLDFLIKMGTRLYDYEEALSASNMTDEKFHDFFDTMKRKGLVYIDSDSSGKEHYRLNAIAIGWYESMVHYLVGKPQEREYSEKFNEYFSFFQKFNFFPLRNVQSLVMKTILKPTQDTALINPAIKSENKRKTIPINTKIPNSSKVYPSFKIDELVEEFGNRDSIYIFPCVCRHGKNLTDSECNFDIPKESCMAFGAMASAWESYGYGRKIDKKEAIDILENVRDKGAVHSILHKNDDSRLSVDAICNCCWDCCGILKPYNMGAVSLMYNASYLARIKDDADCKGCGNCEKFCPTTAMKLKDKQVSLNQDKCIGCGQCALQCQQNNIELSPNERTVFLPMLKRSESRI